jgi:ubiquinone/menaquinone biosynthesis C-methylase UbiE
MGLPVGGRVLELGSGSGYFSAAIARRLGPEGRLLCLDLQPNMARYLRRRLDREEARDVDIVVADAMNLPLKPDCLDGCFLVTVFGELPDRRRGVAEMRRALREGGILSITESLPDPHYKRMSSVSRECEAGGFRWQRTVRRPLGFTMDFVAKGSAGTAPARSS